MNQVMKKDKALELEPIIHDDKSVAPCEPEHVSETTAIMQVIERVASNPDADIAKLEKMLDMQERILDRNARMEFDSALAVMQSELPEVEKLAQGHNSMYAKFDKIITAIKPALKAHGFSITHRVEVKDGLIYVTGILSHKGGHREETTLALPADKSGSKNDVQAVGSSTEYGRRYTTNSLLGIATKDADVDGGANDEPDITDWLAAIDAAPSLEDLQKTFGQAWNANKDHPNNKKQLTAAKDRMKKELSK